MVGFLVQLEQPMRKKEGRGYKYPPQNLTVGYVGRAG
jgi:hypothetical protein